MISEECYANAKNTQDNSELKLAEFITLMKTMASTRDMCINDIG